MAHTSDDIIREIEAAFPNAPPPPRPITGHRCPECDEVDRLLGGKRWRDAASHFPRYCVDTFPLLTPPAQRYYLPTYMCADLAEPDHTTGTSVAWALEHFA